MRARLFALTLVAVLCAGTLSAATFVVPDDRQFLLRWDAVVVAAPLSSYTRLTDSGNVQTVTGGGHVRDLALGKFSFATDAGGRNLLVRDEEEIAGWDPDGTPHFEPHRAAALFLAYLRRAARGEILVRDDRVPKHPVVPPNPVLRKLSTVAPLDRDDVDASRQRRVQRHVIHIHPQRSLGGRWSVFPSPVSFFSVGIEPGAPNGGVDAIDAAFAAWNNDPNSNVSYAYAGADLTGLHKGRLSSSDGQNTIAFDRRHAQGSQRRDVQYGGRRPRADEQRHRQLHAAVQ